MPRKSKLEINFNKKDEIKNKLLSLLAITDDNKVFYLYIIDDNEELRNKILELDKECSEYFPVGAWTYFRNKKNEKITDRPYLTLIRNIFNLCDVKYINKQTSTIIDGKTVYYMKYTII